MRVGPCLLAVVAICLPATAGDRPADPLLGLLPPDAGLTLTIEGLRENAAAFLASPTAGRLMALPAAQAWLGSDQFRRLAAARRDIEAATGLSLTEVRDELLGDAAVLAMYQPPGAPPEDARGILLLRPRDRQRLTLLIDAVNRADARILRRLDSRSYRGVPVTAREFRPGAKPNEWYALLDGPVFAWSNSEALVRAVIDRQAGPSSPNLRSLPAFDRTRQALPARACLGLYVEARFLDRQLAAAPGPRKDADRRLALAIRSLAGAVDYSGIALQWTGGPSLHLHQEIDPNRLDPSTRAWADRVGPTAPLIRGMPSNPALIAAGDLHLPPLLGALKTLMAPRDWSRLELLVQTMAGVEPGQLQPLLESIGPAWALGIEVPEPAGGPVSWVSATAIGPEVDAESRRILGGMLRSALALDALRGAPNGEPARIVNDERDGRDVTSRVGGRPLAFSLAGDRAVMGSSPEAVVRYLNGQAAGGPTFQQFRGDQLAGVESFVYADLGRLRGILADRQTRDRARDLVGRDAARDVDQAIGLLGLFRHALGTSRIAPGFSAIDHTLSLTPEP